ncbi:hypothetical protein J4Q44_G00299490 [Coregonus suidteri]|uniref:Uncharacterized protein n=1 Tax=Coregonus suidteri TaxID=861788 RepID=A0AAN8QIH7_9TELE
MVHNNLQKTHSLLDRHMDSLENPGLQSHGKGARRKGRFKGSDGSTSSDTTTNSFVRQQTCRDRQAEDGLRMGASAEMFLPFLEETQIASSLAEQG